MIITGGKFRGQKITTIKSNNVRPTSSKVRQSIFNMLSSTESGQGLFLDLFSGSGIMGIEALSRGFEKAVFIEKNAATAKLIEQNLQKLGIKQKPLVTDAVRFLKTTEEKFDVIFADPPYAQTELFSQVIETVFEKKLLHNNSILIVESPSDLEIELSDRFKVLKNKVYGTTKILFLTIS
jgi:16S rRNA (guanine(966)-N(2))-methyltransferase RsmD